MDPDLLPDVWIWRGLVFDIALRLAAAENIGQGDPALPARAELERARASVARAAADLRALGDALQAAFPQVDCARCADRGCKRCLRA